MSRLITVVCRHNQARSVMAAAALSRFFPDLDVTSAGVQAINDQRIPDSILNLAESWGLPVVDAVSHSLDMAKQSLLNSDFVIVAEDEFVQEIVDLGVEPCRVLSMQDQRFAHSLIPFDPIGRGSQVVSVELAKAIMTSVWLIRAQEGFGRAHPVEAVFTSDESGFSTKLGVGWEKAKQQNGVLVVSDFRAPSIQAVSSVCDYVVELRVDRLSKRVSLLDGSGEGALARAISSGRAFAISARVEMDEVENFALREDFKRLIDLLATSRPVVILTEPMGLGPCPFLVASSANF